MKHAFSILGCLVTLYATTVTAAPRLAYEKNGAVWVADIDGQNARKIAEGAWPDLSPDGSKIAFNTNGDINKVPARLIAIADVATGKVTTLKNIPGENSHSPHWSPDGKSLIFRTYTGVDWDIGFIHADDTGFRYIHKTAKGDRALWTGCWAADGKSIFCQDLDNLVLLSLDGEVVKKWEISTVFPECSMSSGVAMNISPDGKSLLIDMDMGDGEERPGWEGPAPAIWKLDVESGKAERVTAVNHFAWQPNWLSDDEIIFTSMPKGESDTSTYRGKLGSTEKEFKRVVKDAFAPSVSR